MVYGLLKKLGGAESWAVLVGLQCSLQGTDLTAPKTAQDAGFQTARLQRYTICKGMFAYVSLGHTTQSYNRRQDLTCSMFTAVHHWYDLNITRHFQLLFSLLPLSALCFWWWLSSPATHAGPDPNSRAKGLVTCTICFSGVGAVDSDSSELRRITGTSKPTLQDRKQSEHQCGSVSHP